MVLRLRQPSAADFSAMDQGLETPAKSHLRLQPNWFRPPPVQARPILPASRKESERYTAELQRRLNFWHRELAERPSTYFQNKRAMQRREAYFCSTFEHPQQLADWWHASSLPDSFDWTGEPQDQQGSQSSSTCVPLRHADDAAPLIYLLMMLTLGVHCSASPTPVTADDPLPDHSHSQWEIDLMVNRVVTESHQTALGNLVISEQNRKTGRVGSTALQDWELCMRMLGWRPHYARTEIEMHLEAGRSLDEAYRFALATQAQMVFPSTKTNSTVKQTDSQTELERGQEQELRREEPTFLSSSVSSDSTAQPAPSAAPSPGVDADCTADQSSAETVSDSPKGAAVDEASVCSPSSQSDGPATSPSLALSPPASPERTSASASPPTGDEGSPSTTPFAHFCLKSVVIFVVRFILIQSLLVLS